MTPIRERAAVVLKDLPNVINVYQSLCLTDHACCEAAHTDVLEAPAIIPLCLAQISLK